MKFHISKDEIESVFPSGSTHYDEFVCKLNAEFGAVVHPSALVQSLRIASSWKDSGGNVHLILSGEISFIGELSEIGGEIVWLMNLKRYRGRAWSSVSISSDEYLLSKARERFRQEQYREAHDLLNAIRNIDRLSRSSRRLKELVEKKL